jgi:hypothetical protein
MGYYISYVHLYTFYVVSIRINLLWLRFGTHFIWFIESVISITAPFDRSLRSILKHVMQLASYNLSQLL